MDGPQNCSGVCSHTHMQTWPVEVRTSPLTLAKRGRCRPRSKPRVQMQNPNRTGLRAESEPRKANPNRTRSCGRAYRTESGSWVPEPSRIKFLGPGNEQNLSLGFGIESESEPRRGVRTGVIRARHVHWAHLASVASHGNTAHVVKCY